MKMDLKTFANTYALHDSGINGISYFPDDEKLVIDLVLCNYNQTFYQPGEPELVSGEFIFTGVSFYHIQAKYDLFDQDEILNADFFPSENPGKGILRFLLLATYYPSKEEEIKTIEIAAEDVVWKLVKTFEET
jgi:hypothetical protein